MTLMVFQIRDCPGPNLDLEVDYHERSLSLFSSVCPDNFWGTFLK
jgi:hypothetical protein